MGKFGCLGVALAALVFANAARAAEGHLWAKVGATAATEVTVFAACTREANRVPVPQTNSGFYGGAAGYLMEALANQLHQHGTSEPATWVGEVFLHRCMARQGYVWLPLKSEEVAARSSFRTASEKNAWLDQFYASDLAARIAEAAKPVVPALPDGAPEPLTFAGVRFDPMHLTVAKGVVPDDGVVLSGQVSVAHTARLKRAVVFSGTYARKADAGAVFYEVVGPAQYDRRGVYWCGPFQGHSMLGWGREIDCVSTSDDGYDIWSTAGGPAYGGSPQLIGIGTNATGIDFTFDLVDQPQIGPFKFVVKAQWLNFYNVLVEADVYDGRHRVAILTVPTAYATDGTAVIPFWSHRLVLRRVVGAGVTAKFAADGDGEGLLDAKPATW